MTVKLTRGARLDGKTALVTAAGAGIGRAIARAFAAEGARVFATDIDDAALADLATTAPTLVTQRLDVRSTEAVATRFADFERLDVLVNVAGCVPTGTLLESGDDAFDDAFDLNVKSMWRTMRAALPAMISARRGVVINIASVVGAMRAAPNRALYAATKGAVLALTKAAARDVVETGVRINAISPGTVDTPSLEGRLRAAPGAYEDNRRAFETRQPMGRLGRPEEIAAAAVFLASDECGYATGLDLVIDGGFSL